MSLSIVRPTSPPAPEDAMQALIDAMNVATRAALEVQRTQVRAAMKIHLSTAQSHLARALQALSEGKFDLAATKLSLAMLVLDDMPYDSQPERVVT